MNRPLLAHLSTSVRIDLENIATSVSESSNTYQQKKLLEAASKKIQVLAKLTIIDNKIKGLEQKKLVVAVITNPKDATSAKVAKQAKGEVDSLIGRINILEIEYNQLADIAVQDVTEL